MDVFPHRAKLRATAWLVGERIDTRALAGFQVLGSAPLTLRVGDGAAMIYRYGAVVLFELDGTAESGFLASLAPHVTGPFEAPVSDDAEMRVEPEGEERVDAGGILVLRGSDLERLQTVADALARSVLLVHYEARVARTLERIENPVETLRRRGRSRLRSRGILRQLGEVLVTEMRMVGRAEVSEKPESTWDRPDLDRLYVRLAEEYELEDRDRALSRKLDLLARTEATFLELLQNRRSLHVEWYIVALIFVEIVILVYDLFLRSGGV